MSFELPAGLESDVQQYASAEHISTEEALVKLIRFGLKASQPKTKGIKPITDDEISQLKALSPTFGLLEDVSEEAIDRMAETIRGMKQQGFGNRD